MDFTSVIMAKVSFLIKDTKRLIGIIAMLAFIGLLVFLSVRY